MKAEENKVSKGKEKINREAGVNQPETSNDSFIMGVSEIKQNLRRRCYITGWFQ